MVTEGLDILGEETAKKFEGPFNFSFKAVPNVVFFRQNQWCFFHSGTVPLDT